MGVKISLLWMLLLVFATLGAQEGNSPNGQDQGNVPQEGIKSIWEQILDWQTLQDAYSILTTFVDAKVTDSLRYFGHKIGNIDIVPICYFDPKLNELYPNIFRSLAQIAEQDDLNLYIHLSFLPEGDAYKINARVEGNEAIDIDLLNYHLNYNLKDIDSLESHAIIDEVYFSLNSYMYGRNATLLCDMSTISSYVQQSIVDLLDSVKIETDAFELAYGDLLGLADNETGNATIDKTITEDGYTIVSLGSSARKMTLEDLRSLFFIPQYRDIYYGYLNAYAQYRLDTVINETLKYYNAEKKYCDLVEKIESEKENETRELYEMVEGDDVDEDRVKTWINNYLFHEIKRVSLEKLSIQIDAEAAEEDEIEPPE